MYCGSPPRIAEGVFFLVFGKSEHSRLLNSGTGGGEVEGCGHCVVGWCGYVRLAWVGDGDWDTQKGVGR